MAVTIIDGDIDLLFMVVMVIGNIFWFLIMIFIKNIVDI